MRIAFWKIILVTIVKNQTVHVMVAANNKFCIKIRVISQTKTDTDRGFDGADAWLLYRNRLPDYYVTKEEAIAAGWRSKKANLHEVLPGKMIGGNIYENKRGLLPSKLGRVWREADFDFVNGYRNSKRILYSNDGLIFVSFDHAQTFYELVK